MKFHLGIFITLYGLTNSFCKILIRYTLFHCIINSISFSHFLKSKNNKMLIQINEKIHEVEE